MNPPLCQVWLKLAQWFWRRGFLNIFNIILHFRYYLLLEKCVALHLNKLEPLHPRMICAKFGSNWPSGSGEENLLFCFYLPLEKGVALHLNKLESPPSKDALGQVWLKLAQWFWRNIKYNFTFLLLSPLGTGHGPLFEQT